MGSGCIDCGPTGAFSSCLPLGPQFLRDGSTFQPAPVSTRLVPASSSISYTPHLHPTTSAPPERVLDTTVMGSSSIKDVKVLEPSLYLNTLSENTPHRAGWEVAVYTAGLKLPSASPRSFPNVLGHPVKI